MPHREQQEFMQAVKTCFPSYFLNQRVLEIGSANSDGVRRMFTNCEYIGLDIAPDDFVDVVCPGNEFDAKTASFDTVLSCECFEHNPFWLETFVNMIRVCRPEGLVLMTCATTARAEHGTSRSTPAASLSTTIGWDYYKNLTVKDFESRLTLNAHFDRYRFYVNRSSQDLYFLGFKGPAAPAMRSQTIEPGFAKLDAMARSIADPRRLPAKKRAVNSVKHAIRYLCLSDAAYQNLSYKLHRMRWLSKVVD
jgi:SAM-dependent methyltransferase